jgi:hypothetical protein
MMHFALQPNYIGTTVFERVLLCVVLQLLFCEDKYARSGASARVGLQKMYEYILLIGHWSAHHSSVPSHAA